VTFDNSIKQGYNVTYGVQCQWTAGNGVITSWAYSDWYSASLPTITAVATPSAISGTYTTKTTTSALAFSDFFMINSTPSSSDTFTQLSCTPTFSDKSANFVPTWIATAANAEYKGNGPKVP